jgi:hypothetical protein
VYHHALSAAIKPEVKTFVHLQPIARQSVGHLLLPYILRCSCVNHSTDGDADITYPLRDLIDAVIDWGRTQRCSPSSESPSS